jgi:peptide/nickel transport system substrate-binding protein
MVVTFAHTLGTGPFLKLWEENVKLVLRKTLYFMKKTAKCTALSKLLHYLLPDKQSGFVFIQGKLDFTSGLDPSYKDDFHKQGIAAK